MLVSQVPPVQNRVRIRFDVANDYLGIGLIVIGVALVCGGLILWPRAPQREHENQADGTMADVSRRVDESSDAMDSPTPPPEIFTKGNDDTRTYQ